MNAQEFIGKTYLRCRDPWTLHRVTHITKNGDLALIIVPGYSVETYASCEELQNKEMWTKFEDRKSQL